MKKIILLLLFAAFFKTGMAQITVTTADMPVAGQSYILSTASITTSIDTSTGSAKTWDFSSLVSNNQGIDTFRSKSSMPASYQFLFLTSNLGEKIPNISLGPTFSLTNAYNIYKNSSAKFEQTASVGELNGAPVPIYFSPVDVWYNFPLHFGDTATSSSAYTAALPTIGSYSQQQVRKNLVDGWGTLILPMGTYDVIRVKTTLVDNDSLYIALISMGTAFPQQTIYQYKFIGQGHGVPLLEIDARDVLGTQQVTSITYQDTLRATGVQDNITHAQFQSFPNPAINSISIFTDNGNKLTIVDITGRTLLSSPITSNRTTFDITHFSNGIYFICVSNSDGETITKKLVVQR